MKKVLFVAQSLELLALSVWVGGLIVIIAAVIPAVFNTANIEVGGRIITRTFHGYDRLVAISAALLLLGLLVRVAISGRATVNTLEVVTIVAMIVVAFFLIFYVNPRTVRLQEAAFAVTDEAAKRETYGVFFRYHWLARSLYLLNLGLGFSVICIKVRRWLN